MKKRYYRISEISELTGIARSTLYLAVGRNEIKALRIGKGVFIPADEAARLLGGPDDGGQAVAAQ